MRPSQIAALSASVIVVVVAVTTVRLLNGHGEVGAAVPADAPATPSVELSGFERLAVRGRWEITATQGAGWEVRLDHPPALAQRLVVEVREDRLVLDFAADPRPWWQRLLSGRGEVASAHVVMPALASAELSGATTFEMSGFEGDRLDIIASGASEIRGHDGRYEELVLIMSGAGKADLAGLVVYDARLVLSGAATVILHMNGGSLSGTASGAADVRYFGSISSQTMTISGAGSIRPVE